MRRTTDGRTIPPTEPTPRGLDVRSRARGRPAPLALWALGLITCLTWIPAAALAQPSDATVRGDIRAPGQTSIELLPRRNPVTQIGPQLLEFLRGAIVVRPSDYPGIDLEVYGQAQYQSTDGRRWRFIRFLVTSNRYRGIPDPDASAFTPLYEATPTLFYAGLAPTVLGRPAPQLAPEPTYEWHTPNSVTFPMVVEMDVIARPSDPAVIEHVRAQYDVRLYRDSTEGPWLRFVTTRRGSEVLSSREVPARAAECATTIFELTQGSPARGLEECVAEGQAAAAALAARDGSAEERATFVVGASAASPVATEPLRFRDYLGAVDAVHQALLTASRGDLEVFLRRVLSDRYFAAPGVLNEEGIALVSDVLFEVFSANGTYREQFCRPLRSDPAHSPPNGLMLVGNAEAVTSLIQVEQIGPGWRLARLDVRVRHDDAGIQQARQTRCQ